MNILKEKSTFCYMKISLILSFYVVNMKALLIGLSTKFRALYVRAPAISDPIILSDKLNISKYCQKKKLIKC